MPVKQAVFKALAAEANPNAVLATNTSTLSVDEVHRAHTCARARGRSCDFGGRAVARPPPPFPRACLDARCVIWCADLQGVR